MTLRRNLLAIGIVFSAGIAATAALAAASSDLPVLIKHPDSATVPDYVAAAVKHRSRPAWDFYRDGDRKPADVLAFSQIKPGMVVVDLIPNEGYYTRML